MQQPSHFQGNKDKRTFIAASRGLTNIPGLPVSQRASRKVMRGFPQARLWGAVTRSLERGRPLETRLEMPKAGAGVA